MAFTASDRFSRSTASGGWLQLWRFAEIASFGEIVERGSSWSAGILKDADVRGLRRALIVTELPLEGDAVIAQCTSTSKRR